MLQTSTYVCDIEYYKVTAHAVAFSLHFWLVKKICYPQDKDWESNILLVVKHCYYYCYYTALTIRGILFIYELRHIMIIPIEIVQRYFLQRKLEKDSTKMFSLYKPL